MQPLGGLGRYQLCSLSVLISHNLLHSSIQHFDSYGELNLLDQRSHNLVYLRESPLVIYCKFKRRLSLEDQRRSSVEVVKVYKHPEACKDR